MGPRTKGILMIVFLPITYIFGFIFLRKWNNGICIKCKSDRYILTDYNSDRILSHYYSCESCGYRAKSYFHLDELNDSDTKRIIREQKLKKLL